MTTTGPSREAIAVLQADLLHVMEREPGMTIIQAARRLQLRMSVAWAVVAPLLESGAIKVRDQGLVVSPATPPATKEPAGRTWPAGGSSSFGKHSASSSS